MWTVLDETGGCERHTSNGEKERQGKRPLLWQFLFLSTSPYILVADPASRNKTVVFTRNKQTRALKPAEKLAILDERQSRVGRERD